jgi:serine/threonine-protein kinase HipA
MRLADLFDIEVPPCALVPLRDGPLAYLVARFDRPVTGGKLRQEDFCQLEEKSPKEKYDGSAELCVKVTRRFTAEPVLEVLKLFRLVLFGWWTGNGDMHLKNFSILTASDGRPRLAPAYDLLCTRLVIGDDPLALPVGGQKENLNRKTWEKFAEYCGLPLKMIAHELARPQATLSKAAALIERSPLSNEMKRSYVALLNERARILQAGPDLGADPHGS